MGWNQQGSRQAEFIFWIFDEFFGFFFLFLSILKLSAAGKLVDELESLFGEVSLACILEVAPCLGGEKERSRAVSSEHAEERFFGFGGRCQAPICGVLFSAMSDSQHEQP